MTLFKTIGFSTLLVGVLAITGGVALANNGEDKSTAAFMRLPSVTIGAGGNALVRGAEVTNVENGTITARTEWDGASLTWSVQTDSATDFVGRDKKEGDIDDVDNGDIISFAGQLEGGLTVDADTVREWPDEDEVSRGDNGKHKGWNRPFVDFWSNVKSKFHF